MTLDPRIEAAARILAMWSDDTARHTIDVIARNALAAADAVDPLRNTDDGWKLAWIRATPGERRTHIYNPPESDG